MNLNMNKFTDPKILIFGVWGLKTRLEQFEPKAFGRWLMKPLAKNPRPRRPHFLKNHEMNPIKP